MYYERLKCEVWGKLVLQPKLKAPELVLFCPGSVDDVGYRQK